MFLDKLAVFMETAVMWIPDMLLSPNLCCMCAVNGAIGASSDDVQMALTKDLFESLSSYYHASGEDFDVQAIADALAILAQQPDKAPLIAVLKLLVEKRARDNDAAALTAAIRQLDLRLKEIQDAMSARRNARTVPKQLTYVPQKPKVALMGRKTPYMHDQLRAFHKYLAQHGYSCNTSSLYAYAHNCWRQKTNQDEWNRAKLAAGTRHGYSCPKALADAYRNLTLEQKTTL